MNKVDYSAIREMYQGVNTNFYEPYPIDWLTIFTPIEYMVWSDIRDYNMKMWPQYPIDKYFADFANIERKIIIECDGKQWHDKNRDYIRDKKLIELGWTVYRIPGKECVRIVEREDYEESCNDDYLQRLYESSTGIVKAIYHFHYEEIIKDDFELESAKRALQIRRSVIK